MQPTSITYEFLVKLMSVPSDGIVPVRKFIDALLQRNYKRRPVLDTNAMMFIF